MIYSPISIVHSFMRFMELNSPYLPQLNRSSYFTSALVLSILNDVTALAHLLAFAVSIN